mgnify:CR=1 FL=1
MVVDLHNDEVSVIECKTMDVVVRQHLMHTIAYRYEPEYHAFYFVVDDLTGYVFHSEKYETEDLFLRFYRAINKFGKHSVQASNKARSDV